MSAREDILACALHVKPICIVFHDELYLARVSRFWKNPGVPVWSLVSTDHSPLFFASGSDGATSRLDLIEKMHTHVQTCCRGRILSQLFPHFDPGEDHALTGTLQLGQQAMLQGSGRRRVGWIMRPPYRHASLLRQPCECRVEEVGACTMAASPITPAQPRAGVRIVCLPWCRPPLRQAVTRTCTGIVARPHGDRPLMLLQRIHAMGADHPWRPTWEVMVTRGHDPWGVPRAGTVQMTEHRFFFVARLRSGGGLPA